MKAPPQVWDKLYTTNMLERTIKEIKNYKGNKEKNKNNRDISYAGDVGKIDIPSD